LVDFGSERWWYLVVLCYCWFWDGGWFCHADGLMMFWVIVRMMFGLRILMVELILWWWRLRGKEVVVVWFWLFGEEDEWRWRVKEAQLLLYCFFSFYVMPPPSFFDLLASIYRIVWWMEWTDG
jgi:hypothetical protein